MSDDISIRLAVEQAWESGGLSAFLLRRVSSDTTYTFDGDPADLV